MSLSESLDKYYSENFNEFFIPSKNDYERKLTSDSIRKGIQQKNNWRKYRNRYMIGIERNALYNVNGAYSERRENKKPKRLYGEF